MSSRHWRRSTNTAQRSRSWLARLVLRDALSKSML
jgi:hypothetical protein